MIIKGGPRGKQNELSRHLLRADTNETVRLFDMSGVASRDLKGALAEMAAIASGSRCTKFLYHASISPGATTILTDAQWREAVERLESALGLEGHQRAVVLHTKKDRQHAHVVWNRVDAETLKAAHHAHNYRTHEEVSRTLERTFGLEHVQGVHVDRVAERPARRPTTRESQQAARTGWDRDQAKQDITDAWHRSESGAAFAEALEASGYCLARGDKKDFVILDPAGGLYGVTRLIDGVRIADVRKRFADLDPKSLPSVKEARAWLAQQPERAREGVATQQESVAQQERIQTRQPQQYAPIKARITARAAPRWNAPQPRPTPPTWAREQEVPARPVARPAERRQKSSPTTPTRPAQLPAQRPPAQRLPPLAVLLGKEGPEVAAEREALHQRQTRAASAEIANLAQFHAAQLAELDGYHERRLAQRVHDVEREIVEHNGLGTRLTSLADRGRYNQKLAYLVAKREGIWQREAARQDRVRAELKAAQAREKMEADEKRAIRERLEREAMERRLTHPVEPLKLAARGREDRALLAVLNLQPRQRIGLQRAVEGVAGEHRAEHVAGLFDRAEHGPVPPGNQIVDGVQRRPREVREGVLRYRAEQLARARRPMVAIGDVLGRRDQRLGQQHQVGNRARAVEIDLVEQVAAT